MKLLWIACGAVMMMSLALVDLARCENPKTGDEADFGDVVRSDSWLEREVLGLKGEPLGTTKDLAIDLETGHLALVVIKLSGLDEDDPGYLAVPPAALKEAGKRLQFCENVQDSRLATARRLPSAAYHMQLNRGWAEEQYKVFKQQPYWIRPVKVVGDKLPPKAAERDRKYPLALASRLNQVDVTDENGTKIGSIQGFAIAAKTGQIIYAAVELKRVDAKLYPIPLGAFVVDKPEDAWSIKLAGEAITNNPSFVRDEWPKAVERGWIEYVHVRYGRAAVGGVQLKK